MKRILVVDDDPSILEVVADILRDSNYHVETATNGAEALEKVVAAPPDAVMLDLMMPVMDGWTFVARCRGSAVCAHVPIAVMSAAREAPKMAEQLGAQACITKPFEIATLLRTVEELSDSSGGDHAN